MRGEERGEEGDPGGSAPGGEEEEAGEEAEPLVRGEVPGHRRQAHHCPHADWQGSAVAGTGSGVDSSRYVESRRTGHEEGDEQTCTTKRGSKADSRAPTSIQGECLAFLPEVVCAT